MVTMEFAWSPFRAENLFNFVGFTALFIFILLVKGNHEGFGFPQEAKITMRSVAFSC